ncbi:hypothetical protein C8Q76DRAFT_617086 [Earliella scabrosa]|nr:hypothetical protein C8Q76DRAFT_617086 [Earliella scabrosa]
MPTRVLIAAFALVTCLNFGVAFYTLSALRGLLPPVHEYTYIGDDFPAQLPLKLPSSGLVLTTGKPHFSLLADDDWATLFPAEGGDGFIALGPHNRTFLVSMVHQLHCLDVIRVGFVTNRTNAAEHIEHCLRYLRQMVLCYSDATLEVDDPGLLNGRLEHSASGVGMVHRCKDWTVLRDFMDTHPAGPVEQ